MEKNFVVIDAHNHFLPEAAAKKSTTADGKDFAQAFSGSRAHGWKRTLDLENRVQLMDEAGVDMAVLEQSASSPQGIGYCHEINDGYFKAIREYPNRFLPCVHVPLEGSPQALEELDRAVNELGFKGVSLVASTQKVTLDSEGLFPLYERISELDLPIFIHPSTREPIWGGDRYAMSCHVSREYDVAKCVNEVMHGVLNRFPDLKFIMPHHGGGIPNQKGRMMAWFEPEGWNIPEEIRGLPKTPRELKQLGLDEAFSALFDKLYFDLAGFGGWMPITESAVKVIRPDRLCFGTDFPFEIHEAQDVKAFIEGIKQLAISEKDKRNILGENVKRLFKI